MRLHGLGEHAVEVEANRRYELGPFTVTFVPSLHSKLLLGFAVPFDGELTCPLNELLPPWREVTRFAVRNTAGA